MGLSTAYYTVEGEIVGESTNGIRLDYLTDALGSVTAKVDQTATVVSTARYKPYGGNLAGADYTFGWVGSLGYRKSANSSSPMYIRNRSYLTQTSKWLTVDSVFPVQPAYGYCQANPITHIDPSGEEWTVHRHLYKKVFWPPVCAQYDIFWSFSIIPQNASSRGWLIQKVFNGASGESCVPGGDPVEACLPPSYYEAWLVVDGIPYTPSKDVQGQWKPIPAKDNWANPGYPCSWGHVYVRGELKFVPDLTASPKGSNDWLSRHGFTKNSKNPCSLALPSTSNYSPQTGGTSWGGLAVLTDEFACCAREKRLCSKRLTNCKCQYEGPCYEDNPRLEPQT